jgi:hypothetical protein
MLKTSVNLLKPTGHVMHQQFNIQQLYAMPTLYLCVLYLSENKQRRLPYITYQGEVKVQTVSLYKKKPYSSPLKG